MRAPESDPDHRLRKAASARADAEEAMRDESLRLMLLAVAHGYESLAAHAKRRLAATPSKH
jgi:hypothetical protein